jgi:hypothetical protein
MTKNVPRSKRNEWLKRYVPAEILGTITALLGAVITYHSSHSLIAATAGGWVGEGVGFYGYFITLELLANSKRYENQKLIQRISKAVAAAGTNLLVEFLPAELFDNFIIRPFLMYQGLKHIKPLAIGFLAGKFSADIIFYIFAIVGFESRKKLLKR